MPPVNPNVPEHKPSPGEIGSRTKQNKTPPGIKWSPTVTWDEKAKRAKLVLVGTKLSPVNAVAFSRVKLSVKHDIKGDALFISKKWEDLKVVEARLAAEKAAREAAEREAAEKEKERLEKEKADREKEKARLEKEKEKARKKKEKEEADREKAGLAKEKQAARRKEKEEAERRAKAGGKKPTKPSLKWNAVEGGKGADVEGGASSDTDGPAEQTPESSEATSEAGPETADVSGTASESTPAESDPSSTPSTTEAPPAAHHSLTFWPFKPESNPNAPKPETPRPEPVKPQPAPPPSDTFSLIHTNIARGTYVKGLSVKDDVQGNEGLLEFSILPEGDFEFFKKRFILSDDSSFTLTLEGAVEKAGRYILQLNETLSAVVMSQTMSRAVFADTWLVVKLEEGKTEGTAEMVDYETAWNILVLPAPK